MRVRICAVLGQHLYNTFVSEKSRYMQSVSEFSTLESHIGAVPEKLLRGHFVPSGTGR